MKKQPLKEMLKAIGGGHLLTEDAQKTAKQIVSSAKGREKKVWPMKSSSVKFVLNSVKSAKGKHRSDVLQKSHTQINDSYYAQTTELTGFFVFNDGTIYELVSDEGGDNIEVSLSKNWKKDIKQHIY